MTTANSDGERPYYIYSTLGDTEEDTVDGLPHGWAKEIKYRESKQHILKDTTYTNPERSYAFNSLKDVFRYMRDGNINNCRSRPRRITNADVHEVDHVQDEEKKQESPRETGSSKLLEHEHAQHYRRGRRSVRPRGQGSTAWAKVVAPSNFGNVPDHQAENQHIEPMDVQMTNSAAELNERNNVVARAPEQIDIGATHAAVLQQRRTQNADYYDPTIFSGLDLDIGDPKFCSSSLEFDQVFPDYNLDSPTDKGPSSF
ncbi:hypothetical protein ACP70R_022916 [Stipagrostis hirtigluma subsp. patula]